MTRSTLLSRLGLALLLALGFVAPTAAPERDTVVQTTGAGAREVARPAATVTTERPTSTPANAPREVITAHVEHRVARKYLLHHAWLC